MPDVNGHTSPSFSRVGRDRGSGAECGPQIGSSCPGAQASSESRSPLQGLANPHGLKGQDAASPHWSGINHGSRAPQRQRSLPSVQASAARQPVLCPAAAVGPEGRPSPAGMVACSGGLREEASRGEAEATPVPGREDRSSGEGLAVHGQGRWQSAVGLRGWRSVWASGKPGAMASCRNSSELQSQAGWAASLLPPPLPASRAVCSDVGAHFRQPEPHRWFPGKEAGSVLAAGENRLHLSRCGFYHLPVSVGGGQVYSWRVRQGSAFWEGMRLSPDKARVASTSHSLLPSVHGLNVPWPLPGWVLRLQSDQWSQLPVRSEGACPSGN